MDIGTLLERFLIDRGVECESLSKKAKWDLQQRWREHFAVGVKQATGKWVLHGIDWHAFSYGHTPSFSGYRAEEEYSRCEDESFVLILSSDQVPAYQCSAEALPALNELYTFLAQCPEVLDLYLFPADFRWTLVITHEPELGPYFAWSEIQNRG